MTAFTTESGFVSDCASGSQEFSPCPRKVSVLALVPLHSDFDRLNVARMQLGQILTNNWNGDAPRHYRFARDSSGMLESNHHLVH